MFDGVRDVYPAAVDVRLLECKIEQLSRRANEGMALSVLLIARLLSYKHDLRCRGAVTEDGLCRIHPHITAAAPSSCLTDPRQGGFRRDEVGGGACCHR